MPGNGSNAQRARSGPLAEELRNRMTVPLAVAHPARYAHSSRAEQTIVVPGPLTEHQQSVAEQTSPLSPLENPAASCRSGWLEIQSRSMDS